MVSNCLTINHFSFQYSRVPASRQFVFDESVCWFITRTQEFQVKHFLDLHCLAWDGVVMVLLHVLCLYDSDKNKSKSWQFRMITLCWFGFFFLFFAVWRVSEVIGLNIQCGYVILLIEIGPSCRPILNWDVSQIIWKNMTNYYLFYSGLGWQNPHWFGLDTGRIANLLQMDK